MTDTHSPASTSLPAVAVVILNWNGKHLLKEFLPTVVRHSDQPGCTIYLADNASTDDSVAYVRDQFGDQVRIIENAGNYGYARGYNEALRGIEADYFVLLNSDVEVTSGWIRPVIDVMEEDTSVAACQPKLLDYRNRDTFEYAGAAGGYLDRMGYPFCRGRMFNSFETDEGQYDETVDIFWASGAAMFIRAEVFRKAGGFEEDFFAHMEEIDLCWRIHRMGYKVMAVPDAVVYHLGGGTLQKMHPRKTYLNFRNNRLMITKNIDRRHFTANLLIRDLLDLLAAFQALSYGKFRESLAILRALWDFHMLLPRWVRKRRREREKLSADGHGSAARGDLYRKSIVFLYFIRRVTKFKDLP